MVEGNEDSEVKTPPQLSPFLEVLCKSSGKIRRFSAGTEAGFAVRLINQMLLKDSNGGGENCSLASHIEAVKEGEEEEPVSFGPNSLLVDYGFGWKLQTVVIEAQGDKRGAPINTRPQKASDNGNKASHSMKNIQSPISYVYVGKILLAFLLIFVFGAAFTLVLENLPRLILYINSSV